MVDAIRSEFRKLFTVRSTYVNVIICMLIVALFAGFGSGYHTAASNLQNPQHLANQSADAVVFAGLILAFVGLLLAGHEYRYNTIMYTLTASNRRLKVLFAKFVVITVFSLVAGLAMTFFSPLCTIIGAHLAGHPIGPQTFDVWYVIWTCLFCAWGYAMYAFILLVIMRNQIGAIVTFLILPLVGENILIQLFKGIGKNVPFTALQAVVEPTSLGNHTSTGRQAVVVLIYVAVGLIVSAILFSRRDAN